MTTTFADKMLDRKQRQIEKLLRAVRIALGELSPCEEGERPTMSECTRARRALSDIYDEVTR